jgi:zinc transport system substrate-binding protein
VYQYLARRYGLDLRSVHFEPDELPGAGAWRDLADLVAEHPADLMLWEGPPLPETEGRLREQFGIATVVFDPCATPPSAGDYLSVLRANANRIATM